MEFRYTKETAAYDIKLAQEKWGDVFTYEHVKGVRPNLSKLKKGQSVCASRLKGYYIVMTPKEVSY